MEVKKVEVTWLDACSHDDVVSVTSHELQPITMVTVGWLMLEDEEKLVIARDLLVGEECGNRVLVVPKAVVQSIAVLIRANGDHHITGKVVAKSERPELVISQ